MSDFQTVADRVEIEALRGEFTDAAMMHDYDRLASLFTEDGAVRWPGVPFEAVGRQEIRAGIERMQSNLDYCVQNTHPGTIQLDGDTASGRAYISELVHVRDGSSHLNYSIYHDRYPAHARRLEIHGARLRDPIRRHYSTGGLGAQRSGGRPLTRRPKRVVPRLHRHRDCSWTPELCATAARFRAANRSALQRGHTGSSVTLETLGLQAEFESGRYDQLPHKH